MFLSTHVAAGAAVYLAVRDRRWYVKYPVVLLGGFISHYVLDSVISYHEMPLDTWWGLSLLAFQIVCLMAIWYTAADRAQIRWQVFWPPEILSGLWAWLSWDWEWIFGIHWLHLEACRNWAPRYFSRCSPEPLTVLWEVAILALLTAYLTRWGIIKLDSTP